jgi:hypothetical protein
MTDHYDQREDLHKVDADRAFNDAAREPLARDVHAVLTAIHERGSMRGRDILAMRLILNLTDMERRGLIIMRGVIEDSTPAYVYRLTQYGRMRLEQDNARYHREASKKLPPLTGNLSDVLVKPHVHSVADQQHTHGVTDGGHSQTLHTGEHSHFAGVTDGGYFPISDPGPSHAVHAHGHQFAPVALGHAYPSGAPNAHAPFPRPEDVEPQAAHGSAGAISGPLRLRLFADGSLVVDNPARPLAVYPVAHTGPHEADPITLTLDAAVAKNLPLFLQSIAKGK